MRIKIGLVYVRFMLTQTWLLAGEPASQLQGAQQHEVRHTIKTWAKTQGVVATSSAEAELYALTKVGSESIGVQSLLGDMGTKSDVRIYVDSSVALSLTQRTGLGKAKHFSVQHLWVQERHSAKELDLRKVQGEQNPADMLTKGVPQEVLKRHLAASGMEVRGARAVASRCPRSGG